MGGDGSGGDTNEPAPKADAPSDPDDPWDFSKPAPRLGGSSRPNLGSRSIQAAAPSGEQPKQAKAANVARPTRRGLIVLVVVVAIGAAIATALAITSGSGKPSVSVLSPPAHHAVSPITTPHPYVPSMSANLLATGDLGPGYQSGGITTSKSNEYGSPCSNALWEIYDPPYWPAGSIENFGQYVIDGTSLWSNGAGYFTGGFGPQVDEAVGELASARFAALEATVAACPSHFNLNPTGSDTVDLAPFQPFKFGTQSVAYLMTTNPGEQWTYVGFIVEGSKYAFFRFQDGREPDRVTQFVKVASEIAARLNLPG